MDNLIQDCGDVNPTVSRQKKGGLRELRERGGGGVERWSRSTRGRR